MIRADRMEPADLFAALWRYRWGVVALAIVGAATVYGYSLFLQDQYTATSLVLVEGLRPSSSYVKETVDGSVESTLRTLREQVMSRTNLERIMSEFEEFGGDGPLESRLKELRRRIEVELSGVDSFRISFTHPDPALARDVTNRLVELFISRQESQRDRQAERTSELLDSQLATLREELDRQERRISEFKSANLGNLPEQTKSNLSTLEHLQDRLSANSSALENARDRKARLEEAAARTQESPERTAREIARSIVSRDAGTGTAELLLAGQPVEVRLEVLRLRRQQMLTRVTANHPDVRALDLEIAEMERRVAREPEVGTGTAPETGITTVDDRLEVAESRIADLLNERREIQAQVDRYERRLEAAPRVERELADLSRDYDTLKGRYDELLQKKLDADLARGLQEPETSTHFQVLDPAVTPEKKSAPRRLYFLLGGGLLGAALGLGGGLFREMVLQPLHRPEEIEDLEQIPVLTRIPRIPNRRERWRRVGLRLLAAAGVVAVVVTVAVLRSVLRGG